MNFDLHLYGETPEELLNVLAHLGHMDSNYHTPIPDERHPAQAPAPQPQSEPVPQPEKPKAQTSAKPKRGAQKPAAAPAEDPAPAPAEQPEPVAEQQPAEQLTALQQLNTPEQQLTKIRDLARSLIAAGKSKEVQKAINSTGARMVSKIPEDSYTAVWEQLCKIKEELDAAD